MNRMVPHAWHMSYPEWLELALFVLLCILSILICIAYFRGTTNSRRREPPVTRFVSESKWRRIPEVKLVFVGLLLELLWELAQFPLFTVWHEGSWSYILYGLVHCTLGDLLILLVAYELTALAACSRHWYQSGSFRYTLLFTLAGLAYTVYSETVNVRIKGTWGYTELMPIVPGVEIGGMPFLQWLLIPPVLVLLMRALPSQSVAR